MLGKYYVPHYSYDKRTVITKFNFGLKLDFSIGINDLNSTGFISFLGNIPYHLQGTLCHGHFPMLTLIRAVGCGVNRHGSLVILCNSLPSKQPCRIFTNWTKRYIKSKNAMYYLGSVGVLFFSFAVLSVPAYRMFCEKTATIGLTKAKNLI